MVYPQTTVRIPPGETMNLADLARTSRESLTPESLGVEMTGARQAPMKPSGLLHPILDDVISTTKNWWLLLVAGVAWIVIAVGILRFDYATVATIATLFGFFSFLAATNEVIVGAVSTTGWRILHWILAALFVVVGVIAFVKPGDTFVSLAAVMSFYFV